MHTESPPNPATSTVFLHGSNALVFLLTVATALKGAHVYYHRGYQRDLNFFDFELKTGIYRSEADLLGFCIEDWFIPMMILLAYPILATVFIHLPRLLRIESDLREMFFLLHAVFVFLCFMFLLSIA
ncbi:MAG: hypothetical protein RLZZ519_709 [Bacteroidota bacterium]|jgi:hypothetical protein